MRQRVRVSESVGWCVPLARLDRRASHAAVFGLRKALRCRTAARLPDGRALAWPEPRSPRGAVPAEKWVCGCSFPSRGLLQFGSFSSGLARVSLFLTRTDIPSIAALQHPVKPSEIRFSEDPPLSSVFKGTAVHPPL